MDFVGLSVVMNSWAFSRWAAATWGESIGPTPELAASFSPRAKIALRSRATSRRTYGLVRNSRPGSSKVFNASSLRWEGPLNAAIRTPLSRNVRIGGPLSQSPALRDFAFQFPPAHLFATGSQVGVRNFTEDSPQLGYPLFRRGAVLAGRHFSHCSCHNYMLLPITKGRRKSVHSRPTRRGSC